MVRTYFRRVMRDRRLFVRWNAVMFFAVMMVAPWVMTDNPRVAAYLMVLSAIPAAIGAWIFAIYMWHLSEAERTAWEPWVKPAAKPADNPPAEKSEAGKKPEWP